MVRKQREQAARLYAWLFKKSKLGHVLPGPKGVPMTIKFQLEGQESVALNGGPPFRFNEAISPFEVCDSQQEVDTYWHKLIANGGEESLCGWLKDKFGLSWQIVPARLFELLSDPSPERAGRAMEATLQMNKLDIAALEKAANG